MSKKISKKKSALAVKTIKVTCSNCNGHGKVFNPFTGSFETCGYCGGKGYFIRSG